MVTAPHKQRELLLAGAGLDVFAAESRDTKAAALAERIEERLRGARLPGVDGTALGIELEEAIGIARMACDAISEGALGYTIFAARR
jgi:hypothetical protein